MGLALAAAHAARVGLGWGDDALAFEDVEVSAVAALVEDPLGEVDEGVAVGVGGEVNEVAEAGGEGFEGDGDVVGWAAGGFVVEVPEDDHLGGFGGVDSLAVLHHVDFDAVVVVVVAAALDAWEVTVVREGFGSCNCCEGNGRKGNLGMKIEVDCVCIVEEKQRILHVFLIRTTHGYKDKGKSQGISSSSHFRSGFFFF